MKKVCSFTWLKTKTEKKVYMAGKDRIRIFPLPRSKLGSRKPFTHLLTQENHVRVKYFFTDGTLNAFAIFTTFIFDGNSVNDASPRAFSLRRTSSLSVPLRPDLFFLNQRSHACSRWNVQIQTNVPTSLKTCKKEVMKKWFRFHTVFEPNFKRDSENFEKA